MIVADTNVIAYLWIPGSYSALSEQALQRDAHWVAPYLWRSEFRNLLIGYVRRGNLSLDAALRVLSHAEKQFEAREYPVSSAEVMACAHESGCSAYDCEFVALAQHLGVPLVTTDSEVLAGFPTVAIALAAFSQG